MQQQTRSLPLTSDHMPGMAWIPGGRFFMGSDNFYPEEAPVREVEVEGFWIDRRPVSVAKFASFVGQTGYVTVAERAPDARLYPDAGAGSLVPGSLVFRKARGPVDLRDYRNWWSYATGASWRHPEGPGSSIADRAHHPVTHIAYEDALAYADWAGKSLATESEWEFAARGGLDRATFAWGNTFAPNGRLMANTWQGEFPWQNLGLDGFESTSPAGSFPPNGYGLYDMTGNVWEWTVDLYAPDPAVSLGCPNCVPMPLNGDAIPRRVIKGGSHLCAPNYCLRYRPAARQGETVDTSTCHLGFRCVVRPGDARAA